MTQPKQPQQDQQQNTQQGQQQPPKVPGTTEVVPQPPGQQDEGKQAPSR